MTLARRFHPARAAAAAFFVAAALLAPRAHAHDSWLSPAREPAPLSHVALELATGSHYPLQEFSQSVASVARSGCVAASGATVALNPTRVPPHWLDLDAAMPDRTDAAVSCWVELHTAEVDIEPRIVQVYFRDIHASAAIRDAWSELQSRNLPWHERYRKFARIELASADTLDARALAAARRPVGLDLEIVVLGDRPIAVGEPLRVQVLRDGRPLAGLPVELVSERSPLGVWRETDAEGELAQRLPFGGRWLLRATDLRQSQDAPETWASRFVTLAIDVR